MAKPSLRASVEGLNTAKQRLKIAGITQKKLGEEIGCSRQPLTNFFKGEAISQELFIKICDRLSLDWQVVAGLKVSATAQKDRIYSSPERDLIISELPLDPYDLTQFSFSAVTQPEANLDDLVAKLRSQVRPSIQEQCGTMRILDMSHPVEINDIYTNVNILEKITGRRHKRLEQLSSECESEDFERFGLGNVEEEKISGLEAVKRYQKLIILGKPGAGKTTFLKHLAVQCLQGNFEVVRVPIFVNLKSFAESANEPSLLKYIAEEVASYTPTVDLKETYIQDFATVLQVGRGLILLDGLDEVRSEDSERLIKEIKEFSQQFRHNHFAITCRIAAWEYTFEKFTEVEVADFDRTQVKAFARQWFKNKQVSVEVFWRHLSENSRLEQLTASPLLLTLVCLAFEESGYFPDSRSELYKEGIDALLKKWDAKRGIQRDRVYKKLSQQRKEDLLSQLALTTFKQKIYFFKQLYAEQFIADYIRNLPHANSEPEELQLDSEAILKSIEAQHGLLIERAKGIYSFSHLTFHEYFCAREIVFNSSSLAASLKELMSHVSDRRWREVFLLTAEILRDASLLLLPMKQYLDNLAKSSPDLAQFLQVISDRALELDLEIKPAALRAFYYDVDFEIDENRTVALKLDRRANYLVSASFFTRVLEGIDLSEGIKISQQYDADVLQPTEQIVAAKSANRVMAIAIEIALNSEKLAQSERQKLSALTQKQITNDDENTKEIADRARSSAKARHHIGHNETLTPQEQKLRRDYYYVAKLLVDCLYSDGCMLNPQHRREINDNLFLPPIKS